MLVFNLSGHVRSCSLNLRTEHSRPICIKCSYRSATNVTAHLRSFPLPPALRRSQGHGRPCDSVRLGSYSALASPLGTRSFQFLPFPRLLPFHVPALLTHSLAPLSLPIYSTNIILYCINMHRFSKGTRNGDGHSFAFRCLPWLPNPRVGEYLCRAKSLPPFHQIQFYLIL